MKSIVLATLLLLGLTAYSELINPTNRIDWISGNTVGFRGDIPAYRTNLLNVVTQYGANNTGTSNAITAIQNAWSAASSNDVVYLPNGIYDVSSGAGLILDGKNGVTLRGQSSTGAVLYGHVKLGHDPVGGGQIAYFAVTNQCYKGTSVLNLLSNVDAFGGQIKSSSEFMLSGVFSLENTNLPLMSVQGYDRFLYQAINIQSIIGTTATLTAPLVFDFTNSPLLASSELIGIDALTPIKMCGVENVTITQTNMGAVDTSGIMFKMTMMRDCWVTNVNFIYGYAFSAYMTTCSHCSFVHNNVSKSQGSGPNHSGLALYDSAGILIEDNIFEGGLQPAVEFNQGFSGNAIFGNFFTNNIIDIDCHNAHSLMNLWEHNISSGFEMDGYFGSASHQTLFRNRINNTTAIKRFSSNVQIIGNVLGNSSYPYVYAPQDVSEYPTYGIFELGWPNIGNISFYDQSPPRFFNFPGTKFALGTTNGIFAFTNDQVSTNVLWGNFSNVPAGATYPLVFQDAVDTNLYHTFGGPIYGNSNGTSSNIAINASITVSNGWRVWVAGSTAYQQLDIGSRATHNITGNAVNTNQSSFVMVWDSNGAQTLPNSLLYTNGAPSWWGTNRWPAIDPTNAAPVAKIPAQVRYETGFSPGGTVATLTTIGSGSTLFLGSGATIFFGK